MRGGYCIELCIGQKRQHFNRVISLMRGCFLVAENGDSNPHPAIFRVVAEVKNPGISGFFGLLRSQWYELDLVKVCAPMWFVKR